MSWQNEDNKKQRGKIDRIYVSPTEQWEISYYIQHYLETNNYDTSENNKSIVANKINDYPGKSPIMREDLTRYLNSIFKKS